MFAHLVGYHLPDAEWVWWVSPVLGTVPDEAEKIDGDQVVKVARADLDEREGGRRHGGDRLRIAGGASSSRAQRIADVAAAWLF